MVWVGEPQLYRGIGNAKERRRYNRAVTLELIRTKGPVSKSELSRLADLKFPVISEVTDELVAEGLVEENGLGPSTGGRPPVIHGKHEVVPFIFGFYNLHRRRANRLCPCSCGGGFRGTRRTCDGPASLPFAAVASTTNASTVSASGDYLLEGKN